MLVWSSQDSRWLPTPDSCFPPIPQQLCWSCGSPICWFPNVTSPRVNLHLHPVQNPLGFPTACGQHGSSGWDSHCPGAQPRCCGAPTSLSLSHPGACPMGSVLVCIQPLLALPSPQNPSPSHSPDPHPFLGHSTPFLDTCTCLLMPAWLSSSQISVPQRSLFVSCFIYPGDIYDFLSLLYICIQLPQNVFSTRNDNWAGTWLVWLLWGAWLRYSLQNPAAGRGCLTVQLWGGVYLTAQVWGVCYVTTSVSTFLDLSLYSHQGCVFIRQPVARDSAPWDACAPDSHSH